MGILSVYLQTNVSTCVHGSPHFGQIRLFFLSPPPPVDAPALLPAVSLLGGVGSLGAFAKIPEVVKVREATTLTIL